MKAKFTEALLTGHFALPFAFLCGILLHLLLFIHGEWHRQATLVMLIHMAAWVLLFLTESRFLAYDLALQSSMLQMAVYLSGVFSSMVTYRVFFHRLRHYPGPFMASVTKLWHVAHCMDSKNYLLLEELHKKYGDFVRTGPNELTVFHPDTLSTIYDGPKNPFTKPAWYDNLRPYTGLNTHRSKWVHEHRRRIWDHGFTTKALQSYQTHIALHANQLEQLIAQKELQAVSINRYFYWFSWDVMGQLAFSRPFGMLEKEEWHHAIDMLRKGLELVGPFTPVPWLTRIAFDIPVLNTVRNFLAMEDWCARRMDERIERGIEGSDVSSYLLGWSTKHGRLEKDLNTLYGDSIALIIAGSDTVAYSLIYVFYYLAKDPSQVERLRQEHERINLQDFQQLDTLKHLNGVINEVLRLHPAVPTGGFRETPPEGASIGGEWIPGNTLICAPRWSISRLESCWKQPLEFIPERWYSRPEMIRNKKGFAPFALGTYYCIGKRLAYMEMQYVISLITSKYDVEFAPGESGVAVVGDMVDQFTAASGKLELVFKRRAS